MDKNDILKMLKERHPDLKNIWMIARKMGCYDIMKLNESSHFLERAPSRTPILYSIERDKFYTLDEVQEELKFCDPKAITMDSKSVVGCQYFGFALNGKMTDEVKAAIEANDVDKALKLLIPLGTKWSYPHKFKKVNGEWRIIIKKGSDWWTY